MHADTTRRGSVLAFVIAAALSAACNTIYGPTSPDRNWVVHDTQRFALYARPGSFGEESAAALGAILEDQYTDVLAMMELRSSARVSVFLYNSRSQLNPPLPSDRSGVAFPETNAVHVVCVPPLDDNLQSLLAHEANHVIVQNGMGRAGTSFMNEGLASALVSERHAAIGRTFLYSWARRQTGPLPAIADLSDDSKWSSSSDVGYKTSASFLAFLLERHGVTRLKQLYYASSSEFGTRAQQIYGRSLQDLEGEWLAFLGR
ncbi:MAG TPA: DUF2268 domain-containing putative Zn-dependent protease [Vicinamibacterales bacterium]|nr:DUF2268 domain-containing putative Zn-dependent protease [Vicinamibacterales bacterium]